MLFVSPQSVEDILDNGVVDRLLSQLKQSLAPSFVKPCRQPFAEMFSQQSLRRVLVVGPTCVQRVPSLKRTRDGICRLPIGKQQSDVALFPAGRAEINAERRP